MRNLKIQIWIGRFINETSFTSFFKENYFEGQNLPISNFAKSQNENWIDHDFLEIGFENSSKTFEEKFSDYSYAEIWIENIENRIEKIKLKDVNSIALICSDNDANLPIQFPQSIFTNEYKLEYLGEIDHSLVSKE